MKILSRLALASAGLALSLLIWHGQGAATTTLSGPRQALGDGNASAYVVLDDSNQPAEIGVLITESALTELPADKLELNLALPAEIEGQTPFTHIGLNWNPQGHMPEPIYGDPHFDFHFYTLEEAARHCIQGIHLEHSYAEPAAEHLPVGYVMAPDSAEPTQGAHWVNPNAREFQGEPHGFDYTFIYGFYGGQLSFLEPMVSLATLAQRQHVDEAIALPEQFAVEGAYPTGYSITYNAAAKQYRIALTNFQE